MTDLLKRCETHAEEMTAAGHHSVAETLRLAAGRIRDLEHAMDAAKITVAHIAELMGLKPEEYLPHLKEDR